CRRRFRVWANSWRRYRGRSPSFSPVSIANKRGVNAACLVAIGRATHDGPAVRKDRQLMIGGAIGKAEQELALRHVASVGEPLRQLIQIELDWPREPHLDRILTTENRFPINRRCVEKFELALAAAGAAGPGATRWYALSG